MRFEVFVATRYLLARRKQVVISLVSLISMAGVAAGVAALIVALALNSGFQTEFKNRILSATTHVTLLPLQSRSIPGYRELADRLARTTNVLAVSPTVYSQALLSSDLGRSQGVFLRGVDAQRPQFLGDLLGQIVAGDTVSFGQSGSRVPAMMVGEDLADALGLVVGDEVKALGPKGELAPPPIGRTARRETFRVVAIFKSGLWEFDANWALIPLDVAQKFEGLSSGEVTALEFRLRDIEQAESTAGALRVKSGPGFTTRTWMELNRPLFSALRLEKLALFITISLIVLVAALNIVVTLTMMVMEKTSDIAVVTAMGGLPSTILRIFMLQGLIIGIVGTVAGCLLGCGLVWYLEAYQVISLDKTVYSISYVPFELRPLDVALVAVMAILISFLATIYPARAAARLNPVEGLRYE